ncbi:MAG: ParB/RepB/Spo0J family partition protein [Oscillospiraceae bacterium]|jgi:ParB family chromosome partitioning protein
MLKDRKGPYPYPKRDVSKIPMFNYAEMDRQRQERAEQAAKKWTYTPLLGQLPKEEPHKDDAVELPLKELSASPKNAFRQLDEETYSELKASLQASGLVYPVIVRPKDSIQSYPVNGEYEILAGHNRVRAARDLGWETIKASIVRVDDVQAVRIINDSNLQRTGVTELEKAWAYRQLFDAMNRNGRNQYSSPERLIGQSLLEMDSEPDTVSPKKETVDIIGEMYGQSGRTVRKKIRLTYLIDELYRLYDRKDISQGAAVDLSYLDADTQRLLLQLRRTYHFPLADGSCHALRVDYNEWSRSGSEAEYAPQRLLRIMQAPAAETEAAAPVPMKPRKYTVPETLFPGAVKKRDREAYVEKALRYVLEHDIEL